MGTIDRSKVALYIRWSTEDQGQGHTLAIQAEACRHYCLSQGWSVADTLVYVDEGWSGGSLDRPALSRLRGQVIAGSVQAVVVYRLDRLSRNIRDIIALVLGEWDGRCVIRSATEPIDTASDTGKLTFTLLSSFADFERGTIRARTLGGKRKNAEQGKNAGAPYPFGYERGEATGTYRVVEREAAVVRLIFHLYLQGMGCKPIAEQLNSWGMAARLQGPGRPRLSPGTWSNTAVLRILRNPVYAGELAYGQRARNPRRGRDGERHYLVNHPDDVIRVESPYIAPIVDQETFRRANEIRQARKSPHLGRRAAGSEHLLSGLAWCPCGHSLCGRRSKSVRYYVCSGRKNKGASVCRSGQVRADVLEQIILAGLESMYGDVSLEDTGEQQRVRGEKRQMLGELLGRSDGELRQARQARERLAGDYGRGAVTGEAYQHLYDSLEDRIRALAAAVADLKGRLCVAESDATEPPATTTLGTNFGTLNVAQRKLLLGRFLHRIVACREPGSSLLTVHVDWNGSPFATNISMNSMTPRLATLSSPSNR